MPGCRLVTHALTLDGTWQQLNVTGVTKCERISFRGDAGNSGIIGIADSVVAGEDADADEAGEVIPAPVDSIAAAPIVYESAKMWYQINKSNHVGI